MPEQIEITSELLHNAIIYAKEMRNRYGVLQMLFDCGELKKTADEVCTEISNLK